MPINWSLYGPPGPDPGGAGSHHTVCHWGAPLLAAILLIVRGAQLRLSDRWAWQRGVWTRSDGCREKGERGGHPQLQRDVDGEFVVAATQILREGVSGDDRLGLSLIHI